MLDRLTMQIKGIIKNGEFLIQISHGLISEAEAIIGISSGSNSHGVPCVHSIYKVWALEKYTKLNTIFCLIKSSGIVFIILSAFDLIIWLMTSPKNFEKIAILKI